MIIRLLHFMHLVKAVRRFGLVAVCNAASDLYPTERESVYEYNERRRKYSKSKIK